MKDKGPKRSGFWKWPKYVTGFLLFILISWCLTLAYHPRFALKATESAVVITEGSTKTENIGSVVKVTYESKVVTVAPEPKLTTKVKTKHLDNVIVYGDERFSVDGDIKTTRSDPLKTVTWDMNKDMPLLGPLPTKGIIYIISTANFSLKYSLPEIS